MAEEAPLVSACILSRGRVERLRACLRSVAAQDFGPMETVVLANGCEETAVVVRREFPHVRLVSVPENVGCAPGRNRIARESRGEFLLFLDDDGELRARDAVTRCVAEMRRDPRAGVVSMALFDAATDEPTGWRLRASRLDFACYHAAFAGGACLVRRRAFEEAGGYPEAFEGCGEEFDLTVRLYARGWAVLHFPGVAFHHHVAKSDEEWRRQISDGYAHLQYTIWRLYPAPWWFLASMKALATQVWIDLRHHCGLHVIGELRKSHVWAHRGGDAKARVPLRALELLYFAKYFRVAAWEELERAPRGLLRRVLLLRLRRKRLGVGKLPLPEFRG